jgi:nucleoside-triphosphatase
MISIRHYRRCRILISYRKNIFLTGAPSSGKTTIIKKIIASLDHPAKGFTTEEERDGQRRIGFLMRSLDGKEGYLAHQDIESEFHIRRYGVSIENIENLAVPSIEPRGDAIIILDEIGKMECFSEMFKEAALRVLEAPNIVVGTITLGGDDFIRNIKKRDDLQIIEVTQANRDRLPKVVLEIITVLLKTNLQTST